MATHTKTVSLTDLQQTILKNDLYSDTDNAGLDKWIQDAVDGKINNCWKRFQQEWTVKLMDDSSFTDAIPSTQADFVALVVAFGFVMISNHAKADDMSIDMLNKRDDGAKMVYSADIANIDAGDTITWLPTSKGHNVHFIAGPEGWDLPKKSKNNKEVAITFDTPGVYMYQCTPHATMGMIAMVIVGDDLSNLDDIKAMKMRGKSKKKMKAILADL